MNVRPIFFWVVMLAQEDRFLVMSLNLCAYMERATLDNQSSDARWIGRKLP